MASFPYGRRWPPYMPVPRPGKVGQLMSYLGMVNFYRRFIRGAVGVLKPLTDTLHGTSCKAARIELTTPILEAFEGRKQQMVRRENFLSKRK